MTALPAFVAAPRTGVTAGEIARTVFRRRPPWMLKNWRRLVDERGFPPPIDEPRLVWDPLAVSLWQISRMPAELRDLAVRLLDRAGALDLEQAGRNYGAEAKERLEAHLAGAEGA